MLNPLIHQDDEEQRLKDLQSLCILDSDAEFEFDSITKLAALISHKPIAIISLIDKDRQWFKSRYGFEATESPRNLAFCNHTIKQSNPLLIENTLQHDFFKSHEYVLNEPHVRFYAGFPLRTRKGHNIGVLCVVDTKPGELTEAQFESLHALANQVIELFELRRANIELKRINEMRNRFLSIINHEMRTPLNIIMGNLDLIYDDAMIKKDHQTMESCNYARIGSEQLLSMVSDMVDQVAIDTGKLNYRPQCVDVVKNIKESIETCKPLGLQRNISFVLEVINTGFVTADPLRLKQVASNLLSNAAKYANANSQVTIQVSRENEQYMSVRVINLGPAIEENIAAHIFERFYRAPQANNTQCAGFGLGLPIAKELARRQGGDLLLESSVNGMTVFNYLLRA